MGRKSLICNMKYIGDILYNWPVHFYRLWKMNEPQHEKFNKMTCAPSEDSDKPGRPPSLIIAINVRMKKPWVLIATHWAPREDPWDWMDGQADLSLRWAHRYILLVLSCFGSSWPYVSSKLTYKYSQIIIYMYIWVKQQIFTTNLRWCDIWIRE